MFPLRLYSRPRLAHCTLARQCPCEGGWRGELSDWSHSLSGDTGPYWVMINYPISWMGFHNRLLIVSSSTPSIVIGLSNNRNSICVTFSMSEGKIRHNLSRASIKADISYLNQKIFSWLVGFQWYKLYLTTLISLIRNLQFIPGLSLWVALSSCAVYHLNHHCQHQAGRRIRASFSRLPPLSYSTSTSTPGEEATCKANPHAFILPIILSPGKDIYVCQFRTIV